MPANIGSAEWAKMVSDPNRDFSKAAEEWAGIVTRRFEEVMTPSPDYVTLQDYEDAIRLLREIIIGDDPEPDPIGPLGEQWLTSAIAGLYRKVDEWLREPGVPRDAKAFAVMVKATAQDLLEAAKALDWAARRLSEKHHDSHGASVTMSASIGISRRAQVLQGDE